jgi:pimeloyl-ACP methyl ester carboxylesterase
MMKRPDTTEVLKSAKVPVFFILGEHDTAVPIEKGLELSFLPEFSYIHLCKQSGHMGMLEETDSCNKALDDFLQNVQYGPLMRKS